MTEHQSFVLDWIIENVGAFDKLKAEFYNPCSPVFSKKDFRKMKEADSSSYYAEDPLIHIIEGDVVYLDNSYLYDGDVKSANKDALKEWMLKNYCHINENGISFIHRSGCCKDNIQLLSSNRYNTVKFTFPDHLFNRTRDDHREASVHLSKIINNSFIELNFASFMNVQITDFIEYSEEEYNKLTKSEKLKYTAAKKRAQADTNKMFRIISKEGAINQKFNEVDNFSITGKGLYSGLDNIVLKSLNNFPNIIHGSLLIEDCKFLLSYDGFPKQVYKDVIFNNCQFKNNMTLPDDIYIGGDIILNSVNEHNMLYAIANNKSIEIDGEIKSSLFTGSLQKLKNFVCF